jgi:peptidyl-prolyl cis-trans isomerase D
VQTRRGLRRDAADAGLGEAGVAAAFAVRRGETGTARGQESDTQVVFKVTEVTQPLGAGPDSLAAEERTRIASGLADDLLDQLVARLQGQYSIAIDRAAVEQALSF